MKRSVLISFLILAGISTTAQRSKNQQLEDSIFKWGPFAGIKAASYSRSFSQSQTKLPELFTQWLRKSYQPVGAIDNSFAIAEPNLKNEVQPFGTGINAEIWGAGWDNEGKKVVRQPHSASPIYMISNHIIDATPVRMLTIPGRPVFMRPDPDATKTFAGWQYGEGMVKGFKLAEHPQIGRYLLQYYGCTGDLCQPRVAVYLVPGNKLPLRQLTRKELLDMCEQAIPAESLVARNKLKSTYGHRPESLQEEYKRFEEKVLPAWKTNIQKLREKYAAGLDQPAVITNVNGIEMINIFNGDPLFADPLNSRNVPAYGIYTYENEVLAKSRQDQPQWICISWQPAGINQPAYLREIHRSMTTHFNFEYVYNYFFDPGKLKGQSYSILNPAAQQDYLASLREQKARQSSQSLLPSGVHFFDDFSGSASGSKPKSWYFPNVGEPSLVVTLPGQAGQWVDLRAQTFVPSSLQRPLPPDFKMQFEIVCGDFSSNTGGSVRLNINNRELTGNGDEKDAASPVNIDLELKAGNARFTANPAGYSRLKVTYKGMPNQVRYADELQYSNELSNLAVKAHIEIIKQGNKVRAFINGKEIIALDKYKKTIPGFNELPAGARFTSFRFGNSTNGNENHIYIGNIKIIAL